MSVYLDVEISIQSPDPISTDALARIRKVLCEVGNICCTGGTIGSRRFEVTDTVNLPSDKEATYGKTLFDKLTKVVNTFAPGSHTQLRVVNLEDIPWETFSCP